jgi:hypothetical protein
VPTYSDEDIFWSLVLAKVRGSVRVESISRYIDRPSGPHRSHGTFEGQSHTVNIASTSLARMPAAEALEAITLELVRQHRHLWGQMDLPVGVPSGVVPPRPSDVAWIIDSLETFQRAAPSEVVRVPSPVESTASIGTSGLRPLGRVDIPSNPTTLGEVWVGQTGPSPRQEFRPVSPAEITRGMIDGYLEGSGNIDGRLCSLIDPTAAEDPASPPNDEPTDDASVRYRMMELD